MVVLECLVLDIEDVKAYDRPCEISMTIFFSSFTSVCTDTRLKCTKANINPYQLQAIQRNQNAMKMQVFMPRIHEMSLKIVICQKCKVCNVLPRKEYTTR